MSLDTLPLARPLVVGLGVTAQAVCRVLVAAGRDVVVVEDHPSPHAARRADLLGVELIEAPAPGTIGALVGGATAVLPSPGVPDRHPVFDAALRAGVPILSEFDLAGALDARPLIAVTGTDGKTTVVTLVTDMLVRSGIAAVAAGNTDVPLVEAIASPDPSVFVVEASSFRLAHSAHFQPQVAGWLNFAPDHLDAHESLAAYEAAKARVWADMRSDGVAVANADDEVVMRNLPRHGAVETFSILDGATSHYRRSGTSLVGPGGVVADIGSLPRRLPHDLANDLASAALARAAGATPAAVEAAIAEFTGLPHRVAEVGDAAGVRFVDDSKATVPHATLAAVSGFDSVVLLAGGRNKGLDLTALAAAAPRLRCVVAVGESADEVADVFDGLVPVVAGSSMAAAVSAAIDVARPGDVVLLSPGCTSFDWYGSYGERGDDFIAEVRAQVPDLRRVKP